MSASNVVSLDIVLNELSFEPPTEKSYDAWPWMRGLVETVRAYIDVEPTEIKALLVTPDVMRIPLAERYTIRSWCEDRQVPDEERNFLLGLSTQKPFPDRDQLECQFRKRFGVGLTVAWRDGFPVASAHSADYWDTTHLEVDATTLNDAGDDYTLQRAQVRHACRVEHVRSHVGWIRERIRDIQDGRRRFALSGTELWNKRETMFPYLELCERVLGQLRSLRRGDQRLPQIVGRLFELNTYSSSWVGGSFEPGALPSKITPESDQTLQQFRQEHTFLCPDGIERLFSWHARYTPGDGRIFFFPDEGRRKIIIGHIENKLPTVMYPKR
jgi:hypothetical protein